MDAQIQIEPENNFVNKVQTDGQLIFHEFANQAQLLLHV